MEVIRYGFNPAGVPLDSAMPQYDLPDQEMSALIAYLKTLSNENSPGLTPETIHLATVIGEDADPAKKKAMLSVLEKFFQNKNAQTRGEVKRVTHNSYFFTIIKMNPIENGFYTAGT
jgi:hypothetical protein